MNPEESLQELTLRLKASEKTAFKRIYELFYNDVTRYAHSFVQDRDAARDIAQDIFAKLWTQREQLNERHSIKAFLFRITHNHCLNTMRKSTRLHLLDPTDEMYEAQFGTSETHENPWKEKLKRVLKRLPERRREALELSRFDGLSHEEIADVMKISVRTVNNHIVQALQFLKEEVASSFKEKPNEA